jgi:nuclear pore complex protein Nup98-Nup96
MSLNLANPTLGVTGTGLATGTSFGSSNSYSPGLGTSQATGAANGFGNSTATQVGGVMTPSSLAPEITFGNGFGEFAASGGGSSSFGSPLGIVQGREGEEEGTPAFGPPLQTGGDGGGFGFTFAGGVGNVTGDVGTSSASGTAQSAGFGSAQGQSLFGLAGGSGGGTSNGFGGGSVGPAAPGTFGITAFNGTGGGDANGSAGAFVGFNLNGFM